MAGKVPLENDGKNGRTCVRRELLISLPGETQGRRLKIKHWALFERNHMQQNNIYQHTIIVGWTELKMAGKVPLENDGKNGRTCVR
jgi:hypothetical protein